MLMHPTRGGSAPRWACAGGMACVHGRSCGSARVIRRLCANPYQSITTVAWRGAAVRHEPDSARAAPNPKQVQHDPHPRKARLPRGTACDPTGEQAPSAPVPEPFRAALRPFSERPSLRLPPTSWQAGFCDASLYAEVIGSRDRARSQVSLRTGWLSAIPRARPPRRHPGRWAGNTQSLRGHGREDQRAICLAAPAPRSAQVPPPRGRRNRAVPLPPGRPRRNG